MANLWAVMMQLPLGQESLAAAFATKKDAKRFQAELGLRRIPSRVCRCGPRLGRCDLYRLLRRHKAPTGGR